MVSKQPKRLMNVFRVIGILASEIDDLRVESTELRTNDRLSQNGDAFRSDLFVGIDPEDPVAACYGQSVIAGGGKILDPIEGAKDRSVLAGNGYRVVCRAGVHDYDLVDDSLKT